MRKFIATIALLASLTGASVFTNTQPVSAATANAGVYVVTPSWWGHCTNFGGVAGLATVNSYVGHSNSGDYGDDVAWVPVRLNTNQSIQIKTICRRFGAAAGTSMSLTIRPTRNGQTYYVGADSSYWIK